MVGFCESLLEQASVVGHSLLESAVPDDFGGITWRRGIGRMNKAVPDSGLFNGRVGEALFLSWLYDATSDGDFRNGALQALRELCQSSLDASYAPRLVHEIGLGLNGIGSQVYALTRIGAVLKESSVVECAKRIASAITSEVIDADTDLDFVWGCAGAVPGFLALADLGVEAAFEQAISSGEHLLRALKIVDGSGARAWQTDGEILGPNGTWTRGKIAQSGFAHGSSGIAHSLLELYGATGEDRFRECIPEVFAFERKLYREDVRNWLDHSRQLPERVRWAWCHGAVGVGFSRLTSLRHLSSEHLPDARYDLELAIRSALNPTQLGPDSLCCGSLGRTDFMIEVARRTQHPLAVSRCHESAEALLDHIYSNGVRPLGPAEHTAAGPGLWQGLAGLGYLLLRLAKPDETPCVLILA